MHKHNICRKTQCEKMYMSNPFLTQNCKSKKLHVSVSYLEEGLLITRINDNGLLEQLDINLGLFVECISPAQQKLNRQQTIARGFRMRLHASNFDIQFLSRYIKVFNS